MSQVDPKATFTFEARNGWKAQESGRPVRAGEGYDDVILRLVEVEARRRRP
jgi:hypothetical protein